MPPLECQPAHKTWLLTGAVLISLSALCLTMPVVAAADGDTKRAAVGIAVHFWVNAAAFVQV